MLKTKETNRSNSDIFFEYAEAFEKTYKDNDWTRLESFLSPDITYETASGKRITGRNSFISYLKESVEKFDRQFDSRHLELELNPVTSNNKVVVNWIASYKKYGLPDLVMRGIETVTIVDSKISQLEDTVDDDSKTTFENWQQKYGGLIKNTG